MDTEKVISGLEYTWEYIRERPNPIAEPKARAMNGIMEAIKLLKEQKAVEPIVKEDDTYECICGAIVGWDELDAGGITQTRFNYCPFCGKAVKWE